MLLEMVTYLHLPGMLHSGFLTLFQTGHTRVTAILFRMYEKNKLNWKQIFAKMVPIIDKTAKELYETDKDLAIEYITNFFSIYSRQLQ
jgi:hypothetical protein